MLMKEQITYIKDSEIVEVPKNASLFIVKDNFDEEYLKRMMNTGVIMNSDAEVQWISEDELGG
ncbi:hypothetical protein [Geobacillus sp. B4113_201601]|uniref:hypothetical protein n=1 Tax=Geobacillus sp. B4113_201601 TaxID=1586290 RepID=UPI000780BDBE|nr:hypothetical protein [Geobacillus sp. B4113_201601]KYD29924.1 hypothetical protein B4113_1158 [Geobacillus sp. B4113_201601]